MSTMLFASEILAHKSQVILSLRKIIKMHIFQGRQFRDSYPCRALLSSVYTNIIKKKKKKVLLAMVSDGTENAYRNEWY